MLEPKLSHPVSLITGLLLAAMTVSGCGTATTDGVVSATPTVPVESAPTPAEATTPPEP